MMISIRSLVDGVPASALYRSDVRDVSVYDNQSGENIVFDSWRTVFLPDGRKNVKQVVLAMHKLEETDHVRVVIRYKSGKIITRHYDVDAFHDVTGYGDDHWGTFHVDSTLTSEEIERPNERSVSA